MGQNEIRDLTDLRVPAPCTYLHNPDSTPGLDIKAFKWWLDKGMYQIGHFFTPSGPISQSYGVQKLDLGAIQHFLHKIRDSKPTPPKITLYEQWFVHYLPVACSPILQITLYAGLGELPPNSLGFEEVADLLL